MMSNAIEVEAGQRISAEAFQRLARFITGELGIQMPPHKVTLVESRLLRRTRELGFSCVEEYGAAVLDDPFGAERQHLINAITTNKTDFFREPGHFDYLVRIGLPALMSRGRRQSASRVKVWSAGCSSGEEPYTLAMVLSEFAAIQPAFDFAILGTDVSTKVLDKARTGVYPEPHIQPVPPHLRARYFWRSRGSAEPLVRVVPALRRMVSFHQMNLMDERYPVSDVFDFIFFRNVMIYFDRATQEKVVRRLCDHLSPQGHLFVGHSESLSGLDCGLETVRASIFRKPAR